MLKFLPSSLAITGALLALIFSSMTGYHVLNVIGTMISPDPKIVLPPLHELGEFGLLLLPTAILLMSLFHRPKSNVAPLLFLMASIAFGLAALSIGYGSWLLLSAFRNLAMAESLEGAALIRDVAPSRLPLAVGWVLVTGAAFAIAAASGVGTARTGMPMGTRGSRVGFPVALLSLLLVLLATIWSVRSYDFLQLHLTDDQIEPVKIAGAVNGLIRSALLKSMALAAMSAWSCLMAFSGLGFLAGGKSEAEDACSQSPSGPS